MYSKDYMFLQSDQVAFKGEWNKVFWPLCQNRCRCTSCKLSANSHRVALQWNGVFLLPQMCWKYAACVAYAPHVTAVVERLWPRFFACSVVFVRNAYLKNTFFPGNRGAGQRSHPAYRANHRSALDGVPDDSLLPLPYRRQCGPGRGQGHRQYPQRVRRQGR